ncbi:mycothiol transferase [Streptococcus dentiloxodontae]
MTYLEMLIDSVNRARERFLRMLDGVTVVEANAFPAAETAAQIKSLTWLAWHTARELDFQVADLASQEPVWFSQGWKEAFHLDLPDDTQDWCHSLEEAQKVQVPNLDILRGYLNAAADMTVAYLNSLDEKSLDDIIDASWNPPVTRGVRLVSVIDDAAMHSGQAIYARRLLGLSD